MKVLRSMGQELLQIDKDKYLRFIRPFQEEPKKGEDPRFTEASKLSNKCESTFWRTNYVWKLARSIKRRAKRNLRCEKVAKTTVGIKDRSGEGIINSIEMRARASLS